MAVRRETSARISRGPAPIALIGRERELRALRANVEAHALVTLVGAPGVGKTALSLALLASLARPRRTSFVDLSRARDGLDVLRALALALRLPLARELGEAPTREALGAELDRVLESPALASPRTIVVLDNAEQCVDEVARLLARWLSLSRAHAVVTSREALRIASEVAVPVLPLEVPAPRASEAEVLTSDAVQLLSRRAGLDATVREAPLLAALVRKLDGIPLALELAARRVALLGLEDVAGRLVGEGGEALDLLTYGARDASERQSSLRGAIAWSVALLTDDERRLFASLSAFRGPFSPDDAVAARHEPMSEARSLDVLQSLCDKSLVARRLDGRLGLLEPIRELAAELPREIGTELRLAQHFARRARAAWDAASTSQARRALAWLASELENLLGVFDALLEAGHLAADAPSRASALESAAWLLLGIDAILQRVGPSSLHAARIDRLLAESPPPALDVPLRLARARVFRDSGAMDAAERLLVRALEIAPGDQRAVVRAELGEARLARGAIDDAEATLRAALEEAERTRSSIGEQRAAARLGLALHARGRLDDAEACYERALDLAARLASPALEAVAHKDLGSLLLQRGSFARARAHYAEALARAPHDDLRLEGIVRGNLGIIALEEGELDVATASFRRALECLRRIGDRTFEAHLLVYAGLAQFERGNPAEARDAYSSAIDTLAEVGDARMEGIARAARAVAGAALGEDGAPDNDLAVATRRLAGVEDPALLALLEVSRAHVAMLGAHGAVEARQEAVRIAAETEALARVSDDLRFARRALVRALPAERFVFSPGGAGFIAPDGAKIDLSRRATLARLLEALVQKRLQSPGVAATFDELIAAGWPGERVLPLAAQNRLRVAVTTLRNMGLRQVLVFREGGHLLDPDVPAVIAG